MRRIIRFISIFALTALLPENILPSLCAAQSRASAGTATKSVPKTVDEAVLALRAEWLSPADRDWILRTPRDQAVAKLHRPFGTAVRNGFKLWGGNPELIASCGASHPEECSSIIFEHLWQSLRAGADPGLVRQLDCQFQLAEQIKINYKGFDHLTIGKMLKSVQEQIDQQLSSMAKPGAQMCQTSVRLEPAGDPNLNCFVRAEFAKSKPPQASLDRFLGWIGWRNGFEVLHDPPNIRLRFDNKCAWPQHPNF